MASPTVLFVCTGNTCRSPLAEGLLRHALGDSSDIKVASAGVAAGYGEPANPETLAVLDEVGIDLANHQSQPTDDQVIADATWIIAMTRSHRDALTAFFPAAQDRTFLLSDFIEEPASIDVPDPIGMGRAAYLQTRDVIVDAIPGILKAIAATKAG
ncbi:low molecular weight protein arginine phosphatase [Sulfuriroseicoccus oceanibius]|uniref:protein-tyrosine-phosphatase n=1 Tax=Sulfuriroseicoccus oceanibius TaxID=2707525 RepID=A0A6B3L4P5_9BACT|nr:low molecular weight protein arginine phosphatase [Sulfuriroseicoccus oceanibius]QQL43778.1 low molecular weight protein arginine phosphatase [Sulfuriroseicoccus oceanibius]